jgi:hypothetical protein
LHHRLRGGTDRLRCGQEEEPDDHHAADPQHSADDVNRTKQEQHDRIVHRSLSGWDRWERCALGVWGGRRRDETGRILYSLLRVGVSAHKSNIGNACVPS